MWNGSSSGSNRESLVESLCWFVDLWVCVGECDGCDGDCSGKSDKNEGGTGYVWAE